MRYLGQHPIAKLDRQRSQVRRRVYAAKQRTFKKPSIRAILAAAAAGRELGAGTGPGPTIDFGEWVPPAIPTERELLLRIFPPSPQRKPGRRKRIRLKQIERARALSGWQCSEQDEQNPDMKVEHDKTTQEGLPMTTQARDSTYNALPGPAAALYRQFGACPAPWLDADGLAVLTDLDVPAAELLADTLVDVGLLDSVDGEYALGPEGHLHARLMADECDIDESGPTSEGLDRFFAYLNDAAAAAERLITPSHRPLWENRTTEEPGTTAPFPLEEVPVLDWLEQRLPTYLAVLRFALLDRRYPLVVDLAYRLWPLWLRRRHPEERYEALLLGLAAATSMGHDGAVGQMLTTLAGAVRGPQPTEAYELNRRAIAHYQETGDTLGLAQAMNGLGKSLLDAGHLPQAAALFRDAEQLRTGLGYVRGTALSRQGRGRVALAQKDAASAADLLVSAHQMLLGEGDHYDAALTLVYHAEALAALGDLDSALGELDVATAALEQASSVYGQATAWEAKARILADAGRDEQSQAAQTRALVLQGLSREPRFTHAV
jgi:tetratricopeptide (TPR) repeat protein